MELRDLRYFIAVAEELHFARAAARLHISPPPLTKRIKRIESEMGVLLFKRTKRSVAITAAGIALLDEARRMLMQADGLKGAVMRAAQGESGRLRVGMMGSSIFSQARELQARISKALPNVRLVWHELSSADQIQSIRENRLDLGLVNTPIDHDGVHLRRVLREPLVVAMPSTHPLAKRRSVPLRMLKSEIFIHTMRYMSPWTHDRLISACNAAGFSPNLDHRAGTMLTYIGLVAIGAGIAIVPASVAMSRLAGVSFLRIEGKTPHNEISLAWSSRNPSPILLRVLDLSTPSPR